MEENNQDVRKVIKLSRKKVKRFFIWILVLVVLFLLSGGYRLFIRSFGIQSAGDSMVPMDIVPSANIDGGGSYGYYPNPEKSSIADTREFMKVNYSSTIKTRKVTDVIAGVKNIIKGNDGRIDNLSSSEKFGRISFVIPKSNFETFKDEIERITKKKLYTENINSNNLLSQKQDIEKQTTEVIQSLESLKTSKNELIASHNKAVSLINKELAQIQTSLNYIRTSIDASINQFEIDSLRVQETSLIQQQTESKKKLNTENSNYSKQLQDLDNSINNQENNLSSVNKKDQAFDENIETVDGYVYVEWISIWDLMKLYSPIHPIIVIIGLIIILGIIFRKKFPKIIME